MMIRVPITTQKRKGNGKKSVADPLCTAETWALARIALNALLIRPNIYKQSGVCVMLH